MKAQRTALAAGVTASVLAVLVACGGGSSGGTPPAVTVSGGSFAPSGTPSPTGTATPPGTATATPSPAAPATVTSTAIPRLTSPVAVVQQYYQDISSRNYAAAWALGGSNIAGENYAQYVAGFATTASISLSTVSAIGSNQVQAVVRATQTDGSVKVYQGTYTVANGVLVGASIRQVG